MRNAAPIAEKKARAGRFAPSPTGPLHFGSLVAAVGSYLEARANGGQWLLRIEDVDRPRALPGVVEAQIAALQAYGFVWDGAIFRQSERDAVYQSALDRLIAAGLAYPCTCTRSRLAAEPGVRQGVDGLVIRGIAPVGALASPCLRVPPGDFVCPRARSVLWTGCAATGRRIWCVMSVIFRYCVPMVVSRISWPW